MSALQLAPAALWQVTASSFSQIIADQQASFPSRPFSHQQPVETWSSLSRPFVNPLHQSPSMSDANRLADRFRRSSDRNEEDKIHPKNEEDDEQLARMNGTKQQTIDIEAAQQWHSNSVNFNQYQDTNEESNLDYNKQSYINQQHYSHHQPHQQHKNKRPVYVSISQQTVNGLLSLLLLFIVAICGCLGTIFIMSALTVIESLQTRGNCYLVSLALAHLLVTLFVVPSSALQIMAGDSINGRQLCHYQWLTLELSLIVSQLSFFLIAADSYLGYKSSEKVTAITAALSCERPSTNKTPGSPAGKPTTSKQNDRDNGREANNSSRPNEQLALSMIKLAPDKLVNEIQQTPDTDTVAEREPQTAQPQQRIINEQLACLLQRDSSIRSADRSQKLRLAKDLDTESMVAGKPQGGSKKIVSPGCCGYRSCCGRLKVLIWILLVWISAIFYTYHQHELSYGPRFCSVPSFVSAPRQPINSSIYLFGKSAAIITSVKTPTTMPPPERTGQRETRSISGDIWALNKLLQPADRGLSLSNKQPYGQPLGTSSKKSLISDREQHQSNEIVDNGGGLGSGGSTPASGHLATITKRRPLEGQKAATTSDRTSSWSVGAPFDLSASIVSHVDRELLSGNIAPSRESARVRLRRARRLNEKSALLKPSLLPSRDFVSRDSVPPQTMTLRQPSGVQDGASQMMEVSSSDSLSDGSTLISRSKESPLQTADTVIINGKKSKVNFRKFDANRDGHSARNRRSRAPDGPMQPTSMYNGADGDGIQTDPGKDDNSSQAGARESNLRTRCDSCHRNSARKKQQREPDMDESNSNWPAKHEKGTTMDENSSSQIGSSSQLMTNAGSLSKSCQNKEDHEMDCRPTRAAGVNVLPRDRDDDVDPVDSIVEQQSERSTLRFKRTVDSPSAHPVATRQLDKAANQAQNGLPVRSIPKSNHSNEGRELNLMNNDYLILAPSEQQTSDPPHLLHSRPHDGAAATERAGLEVTTNVAAAPRAMVRLSDVSTTRSKRPATNVHLGQSSMAAEQRIVRQYGDINVEKRSLSLVSTEEPGKKTVHPKRLYWFMLIGSVLLPSLASSLLFARAYIRMKQFRHRANKPMPLAAINSQLASLLIGGSMQQPPQPTGPTIKLPPVYSPINRFEEAKNVQENEEEENTSQNDFVANSATSINEEEDWQDPRQQLLGTSDITNANQRSISQPSGPSGFRQSGLHVVTPNDNQLIGRNRLMAVGQLQRENLALQQQQQQLHKQVDQVLSEPIGFPHLQTSNGEPSHWFGYRLQRPSAERSRLSPIAAGDVQQQPEDWRHSTLIRDHSFSAPPSAGFHSVAPPSGLEYSDTMGQTENLGLKRADQPNPPVLFEQANSPALVANYNFVDSLQTADHKSRPYEFNRQQFHAQSFHYGCSPVANRNQDQSSYLHQRSSLQRQHKQQANYDEPLLMVPHPSHSTNQEDQFDDGEQRLRLNVSRQLASPMGSGHDNSMQLLERHSSLPRSSRLYQSESGGLPHLQPQEQIVRLDPSQQRRLPSNLSGQSSRKSQMQRLQMSDASQEAQMIGPSGANSQQTATITNNAADNGDQSAPTSLMSAALANVIKSQMDKSQSPPANTTAHNSQPATYQNTTALTNSANDTTEVNKDQQTGKSWTTEGSAGDQGSSTVAVTTATKGKPEAEVVKLPDKVILCNYSYMTDDQLLRSNIIVFILNLTLWLPFVCLSIGSQYRDNFSQELKDGVWWLATLNCCSCSYVYALTNKDFRDAFNKLFYYCCCKSHVTFPRKTPIFRRQLDLDSKGNLRIHIIPGLNVYSNKLTRLGSDQAAGQPLGPIASSQAHGHHYHNHHHHYNPSYSGPGEPGGLGAMSRNRAATQQHHYSGGQQQQQQHAHSVPSHKHLTMSVGGGFGGPLFGAGRHLAHSSNESGRGWLGQRHSPSEL